MSKQPFTPISIFVVMATFNGERFRLRQLESIAAQSSPPNDLVVDDRSEDGTATILRAFADRAPFPVLVCVNDARLDFRRNFLGAVGRATSDVILLNDQDNLWLPNKIAVMRRAFETDPELTLAYHNAAVVDAEERVLGPMFDGAAETAAVAEGPLPPWHYARGLAQGFRSKLRSFDDLWPETCEHFNADPLGKRPLVFSARDRAGRAAVHRRAAAPLSSARIQRLRR